MTTLGMEGKKWEIFKAAVELFSRVGYDSTSIRDIVDMSGIKSASFFDYFPSKDAILDTMYDFYATNLRDSANDCAEVFSLIATAPPRELLYKSMTTTVFDAELQPFMDKIFLISIMRSSIDPKAYSAVWKYNFEQAAAYISPVLEKLMEAGRIEPIDIDSFVELYCGFCFVSIFRQSTDTPMSIDRWLGALKTLAMTLQEKPPSEAAAL